MDINKPNFGLTTEEIEKAKECILSWTDSNHPVVPSDGKRNSFRMAFSEGADLLLADLEENSI